MIDAHIHIEKGSYMLDWINEFVSTAVHNQIEEIRLLEHCYLFPEFLPMYEEICKNNGYIEAWLGRKGGKRNFDEFLNLAQTVRNTAFPIRIEFGLEVCYFPDAEELVRSVTKGRELDFLVGSVRFIDGFPFDHRADFWEGADVDRLYRKYFESSIRLAESGLFDGIAHPDCIKLFGHTPSFSLSPYYSRLADALHKNSMYAEMNSGSARRTGAPLGMSLEMINVMKRYGVAIKTASDAHRPEETGAGIYEMTRMLLK